MFKASVLSSSPNISLEDILPDLDHLAVQSGLIVRQTRKFSAQGFLLVLLKSVSTGHASFGQMAAYLGQSEARSLSRQALHQRMNPPVITFLQSVLQRVMDSSVGAATGGVKFPFRRILLEDATQFRMHPKNHPSFRAVANNSGTTAGAKVDVVMDLISGQLLMQREVEGHVQDRTLGPGLLPMVEQDDLVLRDMGYFDVAAFAVIEAKNAFWLSRLHGQASVALEDGSALEKRLASTKADTLELKVTLTQRGHPARLIAVRASPEVAARRRQVKKDKRKRNGTRPSKQALAREDWNILVTNIPVEKCSADELIRLYRQRWDIEIHFRAWKQSLHMHKALHRITSRIHLHALILAAMIFSAMAVRINGLIVTQQPRLQTSVEKLFGWLSIRLRMLKTLWSELSFDPRQLQRCKRKRKTLKHQGYRFRPLN